MTIDQPVVALIARHNRHFLERKVIKDKRCERKILVTDPRRTVENPQKEKRTRVGKSALYKSKSKHDKEEEHNEHT